jgi:hypothetical protein
VSTPFEVFGAFETINENGTLGACHGWFRAKFLADQAAKDKGWYGGNGRVEKRWAICADDGEVFLLAQPQPIDLDGTQREYEEALRKKTLDGLTAEQKRVLGLATKDPA